jgi:hypothetical protein
MWWGRALFITRLEIDARVLRLHTVVRGTPVPGYRQKQSQRKQSQETHDFIPWFGQVTLVYFHVVASQWTRVALNPFQVIR